MAFKKTSFFAGLFPGSGSHTATHTETVNAAQNDEIEATLTENVPADIPLELFPLEDKEETIVFIEFDEGDEANFHNFLKLKNDW